MEASKVRETEVNKMMSEVGKVITSHLNNLVDRFEENTKHMVSTVEILKELPIIKDLETRINNLKEENAKLKKIISEFETKESNPITLKTEEINSDEDIVSYSEINKLVTNEVEAKEIGVGWALDYMANQSDTDTSDEEDNIDDYSKEAGVQSLDSKWIHTPNPGTLLGTWNSKHKDDGDEKVESAETARDAIEQELVVEEEVDETEEAEDEAEVDDEEDEEDDEAEDDQAEDDEAEDDEVDDEEDEEDDEAEDEEDEEEEDEEDDEAEDEEDEAEEGEAEDEEDEAEDDEAEDDEAEDEEDEEDEADDDGLVSENDEEVEEDDDDGLVSENDEEVEEDDEELEVEEIEIEGITYYCTDEKNGILFECGEDGEIGDELGHLKKGTAFFS